MKSKIAELEKKGINPTREHVKTHLNNIKSFSLREYIIPMILYWYKYISDERPLGRVPAQAVAPVQPIIFSVPKPILRSPLPDHQPAQSHNADQLLAKAPQKSKPVQQRKSATPDVVVGRRPSPGVIQRKRPQKKGAKLVVVKVKVMFQCDTRHMFHYLQDCLGEV